MEFDKILNMQADHATREPDDPGIEVMGKQCYICAHWDQSKPDVCAAFPGGIPLEILYGAWDHNYSYDRHGMDDQGIIFEPRDDLDKEAE